LADMLGAKWAAVYVETPRDARLSTPARDSITAALRLAEQLDGDAVVLAGRDLPAELLRHARENNITQIVMGKSRRPWWSDWYRRSLAHELIRRSENLDIHVLTGSEAADGALPKPPMASARVGNIKPYIWATMAVAIAGLTAEGVLHLVD